jgi:hypothetical protein
MNSPLTLLVAEVRSRFLANFYLPPYAGVPVVLGRKLALRGNDLFYEGVATSTRLNFPLRTAFFATVISA